MTLTMPVVLSSTVMSAFLAPTPRAARFPRSVWTQLFVIRTGLDIDNSIVKLTHGKAYPGSTVKAFSQGASTDIALVYQCWTSLVGAYAAFCKGMKLLSAVISTTTALQHASIKPTIFRMSTVSLSHRTLSDKMRPTVKNAALEPIVTHLGSFAFLSKGRKA